MDKAKDFYRKYLHNSLCFCAVWAFALNMIIETLARKGTGGLEFLISSPVVFLYNSLVIFATLSVALLFRRRIFFIVVISCLWLAIGITNGVILMERMTPFTVKDLSAVTDAATMLTNYFTMGQLIGIAAGIVIGVAALIILWIKAPKKPKGSINIKRTLATVVLIIACTFISTFGLVKINVLATFFGNLAYAYSDYGVPYCFINTWLNTGIQRPHGYSEEAVKSIFSEDQFGKDGTMKLTQTDVDEDYPNILFLQLESFTDPELFNNIELSEDAIPYFRSLMESCSSGSLTVPACGAGTANTEFEVMTGTSVKFFGPGEYPFKSILKEKTAESIAYDLKSMGFGTHAIHNHRALFYNRNEVFKNIGYDSFTSVEYMSDVSKTPKNWAKDENLVSQITDALNATDERDYIYTISVQGHGKYPAEQVIKNPAITVTDAPNEEMKWKYEYYVNQLHEMDQFIKDLTETLEAFDEPVVLVMYGDHIPALDVTEDAYDAKDLYQTQYVIWSNFDMEKEDMDLATYQLSSEVFDRLGIHTGTTIKYHQSADWSSPDYLTNLKMIAYDILYGDYYLYGGENPFEPTDMKMGVKKIKIDKVVSIGGKYYIKGENFTEYSKVTLNGETLSTIYLGPNLLGLLENVDPADAPDMKVSQIDKSSKEIVSTTE